MFKEKAVMFLYAVSPVHMGAGTALGAIDNPIQRERHTGHPVLSGSGLKGALRHEAGAAWKDDGLVTRIFGPDTQDADANKYAGALSVGDAQIVLFPVRSLRGSYVYATCPTGLARLRRLLELAGVAVDWDLPGVGDDECVLCNPELASAGRLILEAFAFQPAGGAGEMLKSVSTWLAAHALPAGAGQDYFSKKIATDTVLLSDNRFNYFARNATVVEPHVRIDDTTGTADDGGLFYTENLPPESLMISLVMASDARVGGAGSCSADQVLRTIRGGVDDGAKPGFDGRMIQVGGDATTGRGQVVLRFASGGGE